MGQGHCKTIGSVRNARLTAVCDSHAAIAERVGQQFGVPWFSSHKKLIKSGLCDAIVIATPHPFHPPVAIDCMKAGLHLISEKPLSERVSTADKMVAAAKKNKVAFSVMFQRRFEPDIAKAIELVQAGRIGKLYRATLISPEYRSQAYYDSGSWRATWAGEGGGVMMNQSPHVMDMFVQLAGMPSAVFGRTETRLHHIEVEDLAEAMMKFPNGGTGYLYCSTTEAGPGQMIELFGDKGKLLLRNGELTFYEFDPPIARHIKHNKAMWGGPKVKEVPIKVRARKKGHHSVIDDMVKHLLTGKPLTTSGKSGVASLELANAIMLSSYENRWVDLPLSRRKYDAFLKARRETSTFRKKVKEQRTTDPDHA